jgi:hypothetical protein
MKRAPFALFAFVIASIFAKSTAPEVVFISPCGRIGFHGKNRWIAKTDLSPVPLDKSAIQSVTPSQMYAWEGPGPDVELTRYTEARMPSEQKWYALTGRIVDAKVEADGNIHIALIDATGNRVGTVSAEIPIGPKRFELRRGAQPNASAACCSVRARSPVPNTLGQKLQGLGLQQARYYARKWHAGFCLPGRSGLLS